MSRRPSPGPAGGEWRLSHDVRVWALRAYEGRKRRTYTVRWTVADHGHQQTFATRAMADAHRAKLLSFVQKGIPFDRTTGLPETTLREQQERSWYEHACRYVDMKWPTAAPNYRRSIAEALATVTPALLSTTRGQPSPEQLRAALHSWAFVLPARLAGPPPQEFAATVRWLERGTVNLSELNDRTRGAELVRAALDLLAVRLDGKPAAPNTIARKRAVLCNALSYAVELGLLTANPIDHIGWRTPRAVETVDRRVVVNPAQVRRLLAAVGEQGEMGARLVAFFGCMYYAALRPGEALGLYESNLTRLPERGWGELLLGRSTPRAGTAWTDTGRSREDRGLKHRAADDTRPVPAHPDLVALLRRHLARFGVGRDGRLFVGPFGGLAEEKTYLDVWRRARAAALTPSEVASPLARRPYDLRHAAVSTWLNAGVPPTQVAEWAGHSVAVLLRTYAKCIVGQDEAARRRIADDLDSEPDQHVDGS